MARLHCSADLFPRLVSSRGLRVVSSSLASCQCCDASLATHIESRFLQRCLLPLRPLREGAAHAAGLDQDGDSVRSQRRAAVSRALSVHCGTDRSQLLDRLLLGLRPFAEASCAGTARIRPANSHTARATRGGHRHRSRHLEVIAIDYSLHSLHSLRNLHKELRVTQSVPLGMQADPMEQLWHLV